MLAATGLRSHIWNNNLKSILLLAGFPFLILGLIFGFTTLFIAFMVDEQGDLARSSGEALEMMPLVTPWALLGVAIWFAIAWFSHQAIIDAATGARKVTREQEPELYNLLENLCISRGLTMPALRVIESSGLNAYASGLTEKQASVTVTRGLMEALDRDEMEAVLAHELTHIINRDVRLLVISIIFVGIISFTVELLVRGLFRASLVRAGGSRRGSGGNAGVFIFVGLALAAFAWLLAVVIRFTLSRKREYMADAGAVELTKNPDAMISALLKVSGNPDVERAPAEVRQMFLHVKASGVSGIFATHPPMEKRIAALERFAGGVRPTPRAGAVPSV
ncbi:MAG: M48 family metallopeptidase [Caulobacterales bacterium]|uniref:M48 family metallopeptidase n=1 Tax=Glycocaulis sp. TaxID=1969725 RepID=UPI003F9F9ACA